MGPLLKLDSDMLGTDGYGSRGIDKIPEDVAGLGRLIAVTDLRSQQSI